MSLSKNIINTITKTKSIYPIRTIYMGPPQEPKDGDKKNNLIQAGLSSSFGSVYVYSYFYEVSNTTIDEIILKDVYIGFAGFSFLGTSYFLYKYFKH